MFSEFEANVIIGYNHYKFGIVLLDDVNYKLAIINP